MAKEPRHPAPDGLKESLAAALSADRARRAKKARPQTKGEKRIRKVKGQRGQGGDMSPAERLAVNQLVSPEAQRHGHYRPVDFRIQEVIEGGKVKAKTMRVVRNLGASPVDRWAVRGKLDERKMAAILFYQSAWAMHIGEPRVTANYSPGRGGGSNQAIELWASSRMRAKESLRLLDQEVFFRIPVEHFQVWQNVVIWDEPAGVAGGRIGFCHKPAEAAALLIVGLVASMIADVVINDTPRDWGELLLDIDAPRRARRKSA